LFRFGHGSDRSVSAKSPDWLLLPVWDHGKTEIAVPEYHSIAQYEDALIRHDRSSAAIRQQIKLLGTSVVNLEDNSCTCSQWRQARQTFPARDLRRVCVHIAKAIIHRQHEYTGARNQWTLCILYAIANRTSYGVFASFTSKVLEFDSARFLALYDNSRGYVELFSGNGGCFGYDSSRNRWANGEGPNDPLAVKRVLRPWIESLDAQFKNGKFEATTR
jgi:hypothetical protein